MNIPDWTCDCVYFSTLLPRRHPTVWHSLAVALESRGVAVRWLANTRDIWARDFMPVQIGAGASPRFVRFVYDPDYLAEDRRRITPDAICNEIAELGEIRRSQIILDGGNLVAGSQRVIVTDKLFRENRAWSEDQLLSELQDVLEVEAIIVIPADPEDEIGHADGVVRFLNDEIVVVSDYSRIDRAYARDVRQCLDEAGLQVVELPFFCRDERGRDGISSAVGNYVNYLRVGNLILMPGYGVRDDEAAVRTMQRLLPEADVVSIRCDDLAREGGVLNCVSWTAALDYRAAGVLK